MITIWFKCVTLILGFGTILAHGPDRLGVHIDYPKQCTSPLNTTKTNSSCNWMTRNKKIIENET
jgi:hypothetical protein